MFDAQSKPSYVTGAGAFGALGDQSSPEVLDIMKAAGLAEFKLFWEHTPQDLKEDIPRDSLTTDTRRFMDYSDRSGGLNIIHLRV